MTKKLYRTIAFAVAEILCLFNALPAESGMAIIERKQSTPSSADVKQVPAKKKSSFTKRSEKQKQKVHKTSEFVATSCLILGDMLIVSNDTQIGTSAFDPVIVNRIFDTNTAVCPPGPGSVDPYFNGHISSIPSQLEKQSAVARKISPAFENFVSPIPPQSTVVLIDNIYAIDEVPGFERSNAFTTSYNSKNTAKGSTSPFNYSYKKDKVSLNTGISWINDITDSNGLSQNYRKAGFDSTYDKVPGVNLNLGASYQALSLTGGYIRALDRNAPSQSSFSGKETEPGAWNSELAYTTELLRKETILTVVYQKTTEPLKLYLPEQRYITKASMAIFDGTTLSLEYYYDKDYSVENRVTSGDGYGVTTRIGFEFK